MIGSTHPSLGMNKKLFINTLYWEFLNEMTPVPTGRAGQGGGICDSEVVG